MNKPKVETLLYYNYADLSDWLGEEFEIDTEALWEWLCLSPMYLPNNDSYGAWYIDDWLDPEQGYPDFVGRVAEIVRDELGEDELLNVWYCW